MPYKCEAAFLSPDKPVKYWLIFSKTHLCLREELILLWLKIPLVSDFLALISIYRVPE